MKAREEYLIGVQFPTKRSPRDWNMTLIAMQKYADDYHKHMIEEEKIMDKVYGDLVKYDKEVCKHNRAIIKEIAKMHGRKTWRSVRELIDFVDVKEKMEIVDKPTGDDNKESIGVFDSVYVDQWSVGTEGDSFAGYIYGRFASDKWLKIPYSC